MYDVGHKSGCLCSLGNMVIESLEKCVCLSNVYLDSKIRLKVKLQSGSPSVDRPCVCAWSNEGGHDSSPPV